MTRAISEEVTVITQFHLSPKRRRGGGRGAHLVVLSGHNVGQVYTLEKERTDIGREDGIEIQIMDAGISRFLAENAYRQRIGTSGLRCPHSTTKT